MSSAEAIAITQNHQAAHEAAVHAASLTPFSPDLKPHYFKEHSSWIYFNEGVQGPDIAVKVEPDADGQLLSKRIISVALTEEFRNNGAPFEEHHIKPQRIGNYVVTVTSYLPEKYGERSDFWKFGAGIAALHATHIAPVAEHLTPFDPLAVTRRTLDKLHMLRNHENLPRLGSMVFEESLVDRFELLVKKSEAAIAELVHTADKKGYPPMLLHDDISPHNTMLDKNGQVVFIDIDKHMAGPWAYNFARPLGQWWRFGRSAAVARTLLQGYAEAASWKLDNELIKLGIRAAHAPYAGTLMARVADSALRGEPQDEYLLGESINRISGQPYWSSEHQRQKNA